MIPTPQKNQVSAPQQTQPINADVMKMLEQKGSPSQPPQVEKLKQQIKIETQKHNIPIDELIKIGDMAKQSIKDPSIYQMLIQKALATKLFKPEELKPSKNGMDLRLVAAAVTIGKVAQMIKDEGGA